MIPIRARVNVRGKRSRISWETGCPEIMERPKSNRKTLHIHCAYWAGSDLSVPSFIRIAEMSLSVASIPAITRAGSPGMTRMTRKTMVEINKTVRINRKNLLTANSKIYSSFFVSKSFPSITTARFDRFVPIQFYPKRYGRPAG